MTINEFFSETTWFSWHVQVYAWWGEFSFRANIDDDGIVNTGSNVESSVSETSSPAFRKSKQPTKPPQWMQDGKYAVNMRCRAMLNAVIDKS